MFKKIFINICRFFNYEIIDQNQFISPTLNKTLDKNLSKINKKSIVLPLGEVKITRKVKSLLIVLRINTKVLLWEQNKQRLFGKEKKEYTYRSLYSLIRSIKNCKTNLPNIDINLKIVDDNSDNLVLKKINDILELTEFPFEVINLNRNEFKNEIDEKINTETYGNLSSLLKCFYLAKKEVQDLVFFVEDDYLHKENVIEELLLTYERISSQVNDEIILCPSDYPFLYMEKNNTSLLIGSHRHWQIINRTLCTFLTSKIILNKYWKNFKLNCKKKNDPFEKYLNKIYEKKYCLSPLPSLSVHLTNINSSYGISPYIDIKNLWNRNSINEIKSKYNHT